MYRHVIIGAVLRCDGHEYSHAGRMADYGTIMLCMYVCMYACMYVYMYACMYVWYRTPAAVRSSIVLRTSGRTGTEEAAMPRNTCTHTDRQLQLPGRLCLCVCGYVCMSTCCLSADHSWRTPALLRWLWRDRLKFCGEREREGGRLALPTGDPT